MRVLLIVGTLLVAVAIIATTVLRRRRESVWKDFASAHGLEHSNGMGPPRVEGVVDGKPFTLTAEPRGSDTGPLGAEEVRMSMKLRTPMPAVRLEPNAGVPSRLTEFVVPDRIPVGDDEFDHKVVVRSDDPEAVERHLTTDRRRALLRLFEGRNVEYAEGELSILDRTMTSRRDRLESHFVALRVAADELEGEER